MQRPGSPASLDEGPRKDKGFRRYASNVERALSLFDTALQEWADYISFLGRLLKALQSRPSDTHEIPHNSIVAKRLAQCLAPTLPSGVHQKTLEVYTYVFSVLGKTGLSKELPLWLPGLSPTLSFASLSIKPSLLSLYENFLVPLDPKILRFALKAIILALLPGLEEETSEESERTLRLLNRFREAVSQDSLTSSIPVDVVGDQYFWQSLFLASITSSSRRQGALAYLIRELPVIKRAFKSTPDSRTSHDAQSADLGKSLLPEVEAVTSPEPGLLVRCFATGLQDEQLLTQRGFLDLLISHLPLDSPIFHSRVAAKDLELLVVAAASVVARREMSLNRRLWSWLLGPETSSGKGTSTASTASSPDSDGLAISSNQLDTGKTYFERYGLQPLVSGLLKMINDEDLSPLEKARPFRICLSLMDRWEIGGAVIPRIFLPALESIWQYQKAAPSKDAFVEVLRSANVFFDGIESSLVWSELTHIMLGAFDSRKIKSSSEPQVLLDLVLFVISKFNIREEEMVAVHIPRATLALLIRTRYCLEREEAQREKVLPLIATALKIAVQLLDAISQHTLEAASIPQPCQFSDESQEILDEIQVFYERVKSGSEDVIAPLQKNVVRDAIVRNASRITVITLGSVPIPVNLIGLANALLEKTLQKAAVADQFEYEGLMSRLHQVSGNFTTGQSDHSFPLIAALSSLLETICQYSSSTVWESDPRVRQFLPKLLSFLWEYTSPSEPKYNVEAVRCLWRVHRIAPDAHLVEGSIAGLLIQSDGKQGIARTLSLEGTRRFITFWTHSFSASSSATDHRPSISKSGLINVKTPNDHRVLKRPLMLILDSLFDKRSEISLFVSNWLQSLLGIGRIFDILVQHLDHSVFLKKVMLETGSSDTRENRDEERVLSDLEECHYFLQTILNLVQHSGSNIRATLTGPANFQNAPLVTDSSTEKEVADTRQSQLANMCLKLLQFRVPQENAVIAEMGDLRQTSVLLLHQLMTGETSDVEAGLALDIPLIKILVWSIEQKDTLLQVPLMDLLVATVKKRLANRDTATFQHQRQNSRESSRSVSQISLGPDGTARDHLTAGSSVPPPELLDCLIFGISSPNSRPVLEHWITFMNQCLPFFTGTMFQCLMPLVDCFIKTLEPVFQRLQALFAGTGPIVTDQNEYIATLHILINGLEYVLAKGHDQLRQDEGQAASTKSPEQVQGFFGNMVSGVFSPEAHKSRAAIANNRLTVLLCFKDTVRICFDIWSWGDVRSENTPRETTASASFNYTSVRLRHRTRRILEHLFAAEALECLETLVESWHKADSIDNANTVFNLLHALEGSRPRNTIPALFNAIYSRTNPTVLEPVRKSTLASELSDSNIAIFLVAYTRSMEDDALDEIWHDCMTFLRDVLGNPLPHRQALPTLLQFTAVLGEKIDNTNFGEQRKMRRDIGDLFVRLLSATFTIKPLAFPQDLPMINGDSGTHKLDKPLNLRFNSEADDIVFTISSIAPAISKILVDADRIATAFTTISTQILTPTLRWKTFPHNVTVSFLDILTTMARVPEVSKTWRKDVAEAFNDARFFHFTSLDLIQKGWMPVLRQWILLDRDRMVDLLSRLPSPTSAGIMFGVGASSARLEADRKAQLNLRRMALLILSADHDTFIVTLGSLQEKLIDLMTATAASSPSSTTRADLYIVLRCMVQKISPVHLASLWPIIIVELHEALSSLKLEHNNAKYSIISVLQAAKLLDTLLGFAPDDFQLCEWLFISDTIDAVYRPVDWRPVALVDELADGLDARTAAPQSAISTASSTKQGRQLSLSWEATHDVPRERIVELVLRPFLRQLSITTFESTYHMEALDRETCVKDILQDLFDETTLV